MCYLMGLKGGSGVFSVIQIIQTSLGLLVTSLPRLLGREWLNIHEGDSFVQHLTFLVSLMLVFQQLTIICRVSCSRDWSQTYPLPHITQNSGVIVHCYDVQFTIEVLKGHR